MKKRFPFLVIICGPTATGKSAVAFELAKEMKAEIVNFDSIQFYKDVEIGAAKPSNKMREAVKHHLFDVVEPNEIFSAGDFRKRAIELLETELKKKELVFLVGGTGFYLRALLKGMFQLPPGTVNPEIKIQLQKELVSRGSTFLYEELKKIDPKWAQTLHPNDSYRVMRGLEIWRGQKVRLSELKEKFSETEFAYPFFLLGLKKEKEMIAQAVKKRTETMLKSGLIEETRDLIHKYGFEIKPLQSVGYHEAVSFLKGDLKEDDLPDAITRATMGLVKRQMTWFKKEDVIWFDGEAIRDSDSVGPAKPVSPNKIDELKKVIEKQKIRTLES